MCKVFKVRVAQELSFLELTCKARVSLKMLICDSYFNKFYWTSCFMVSEKHKLTFGDSYVSFVARVTTHIANHKKVFFYS
jgi:hypothetical protein